MRISVFYDHIVEAAKQTGKEISEICGLVRKFGIEAVEIDASCLYNQESEMVSLFAEAGLKINCIYSFFDFGNVPDVKKGLDLVDLAKHVGSDKILIVPGFIKEPSEESQARERMKAVLIEICSYANSNQISVGMEDFDDCSAPFSTIQQLKWFMEQVPLLTCTFDTGNFLYSEEDVLSALYQLEQYIGHVHLKDRTFEKKEGEQPKLTVAGREMFSSPVGNGCIPMGQIIDYLLQAGYHGTFAIEHFGSKNQLEDMKRSSQWLLAYTHNPQIL